MQPRRQTVLLQGLRYCVDPCLEGALRDALRKACHGPVREAVRHRVPLGLLLVSRRQLTNEQLRAALAAQQDAGHGRLGEWLQKLGYASEEQITAALARQWSCPVLRADSLDARGRRIPSIPLTLMRWMEMFPLDFVESTRTLHLAFADGLDYRVLYAMEQMLDCRTQPCLLRPSQLQSYFAHMPESRGQNEVRFERLTDMAEFARIAVSYALRVSATQIRLTSCGCHIWVRLLRSNRDPLDLVVGEIRSLAQPGKASQPEFAAV